MENPSLNNFSLNLSEVVINFAGFPATTLPAGKLLVTTEPQPTIQLSPKVTPSRITDRAPIKQLFPIIISPNKSEYPTPSFDTE